MSVQKCPKCGGWLTKEWFVDSWGIDMTKEGVKCVNCGWAQIGGVNGWLGPTHERTTYDLRCAILDGVYEVGESRKHVNIKGILKKVKRSRGRPRKGGMS